MFHSYSDLQKANRHQGKCIATKCHRPAFDRRTIQPKRFRPFFDEFQHGPEDWGDVAILVYQVRIEQSESVVDVDVTVQTGLGVSESNWRPKCCQ